jgi:formylglycine-generating enzyme required for sulfatase activity
VAIGDNEKRPIVCITWYEAFAFCAWDGARLPTEAEWNYAAAGGSEQRAYPWSTPASPATIDCAAASYDHCVAGEGDPSNLIVVGSKPAGNGKWGQADLGGNVWEWNLDGWASSYGNPCADCANLTDAAYRVVRGGSFNSVAQYILASHRSYNLPVLRSGNTGARCARTP